MEFINATGMVAGYTMGLQPDGRELLVVVVKGTFAIPEGGGEPELAKEQVPLVEADVFTGEPGFSAPLYESDYAPRKPRCDVLLNGSAHAPGGKPTDRVTVALGVGAWSKSFDVVGDRVWRAGLLYMAASEPAPFTVMPISYNNAFGGVDRSHEDPAKHLWHPTNPFGVGYHENTGAKYIDGKPLPNTEETGRKVTNPQGKYRPMAFGPIARAWEPRPKHAGTYDQNWLDNVCPFLPLDFREEYFQAAPSDQQIDYPQGGEEVELRNLTSGGRATFSLPKIEVPVEFYGKASSEAKRAVCDTIVLEPDQNRFFLVWRVARPLKRNIFEVHRVVTGRMSRGWYRAREANKDYYISLAELLEQRKAP
jgi:hypothetical protein